jgi:hypothetical protein
LYNLKKNRLNVYYKNKKFSIKKNKILPVASGSLSELFDEEAKRYVV